MVLRTCMWLVDGSCDKTAGRRAGSGRRRLLLAVLEILVLVAGARAESAPEHDLEAETFFEHHVQSIFEQHCFECHSHQAKQSKGGLVLDSRRGWETGGESGPAIVPGKPADSLLLQAVRYEDLEMPPRGKLPDELIRKLEQWIAAGAHDPRGTQPTPARHETDLEAGRRHWAFQPLEEADPPVVDDHPWPRNFVDRFVLSKLEAHNLRPVADADAYVWLRRVTFDLTGLPPSLAEIRALHSDTSATAREKVVDRLLSSPAFGERWARHWLDLVGYADQIGTSNNVFAQHAWRYRDYVIRAWNHDKPLDQFIREQIAGDLLPWDSVEQRADQLTATGFLVLGDIEIVEADKAKLLVDIVDQQLSKVGKAMLGMTLECARCHDHKFDPISQQDYYAIAGFFHGTSSVYKTDRGVWSDVNVLDLPETEPQRIDRARRARTHRAKLESWKHQRELAEHRKDALEALLKRDELPHEERDQRTSERDVLSKNIAKLNRQIQHAEFFAPAPPQAHGVHDVEHPADMRITIRGNPRALGAPVPRGFLQVMSEARPDIPPGQSGRRELADWVADNPLTARVVVNRLWQKLFGEGLVRSVDYVGVPGDVPSHPALLDELAVQFIHGGWSQKRLIRTLVLSRTYGLDSRHDELAYATDPDNRLLWRMNRFRLDAEAIRDAMLSVTGQLTSSSGGPALPLEFPENVGGLDPKDVNPPSFQLAKWRSHQAFERSIYLPVIRHAAQPGPAEIRNVFDFAQPSQFAGKRAVTAVPTQALFLMNSPVVKQHATVLAERLNEIDASTQRLERLWLTLLNRPITTTEQRESLEFLQEAGENAWVELCHALLASNEFLMRM